MRRAPSTLLVLLVVGLALATRSWRDGPATDGATDVLAAFEARAEEVQVTGRGTVTRVLPDDEDGSRHQRFVLAITDAHTVLVAHNIDLAPRIPDLAVGDEVAFVGAYVFNERGGVIHWTHHDPAGRHPGGWLEHDGARYE